MLTYFLHIHRNGTVLSHAMQIEIFPKWLLMKAMLISNKELIPLAVIQLQNNKITPRRETDTQFRTYHCA